MSVKALIKKIEIPNPDGTGQSFAEKQMATEDLLPVPTYKRLWRGRNFCEFWIADSVNLNTFQIAATGVEAGLSWWVAWLAIAIGYMLVAPFLVLNGRPGSVFHIKFPVIARTSFGMYGAYWIVLNRTVMSVVWWGVQSWLGGQALKVMLEAMSTSFANMPNTIASSGTTTKDFVAFFIYWVISLFTLWPPIEKARHFFTVKAIIAPIAGVTLLAWTISLAHGIGPIIHQTPTVSGKAAIWPAVASIMSALSNCATLITNNADITSYASKPSSAFLPQLITLPIGFIITSLFGILIASASQVIWGETLWQPTDILSKMLEGSPSGATRFGVWYLALSFTYIQLIMNLSANSISAGCDMTALLPQWINIRRGSYICALVGLAYCPWNLFSSSNAFSTYLSAYSVLLSSVAGVMLCEYYIVKKGSYRVADLYSLEKDGWYYYTKGFNLRAFVAYVAGIAPNLPGLINACVTATGGAAIVGTGADKIYAFSWFVGITISMSVYYALNRIWPEPGAFPPQFQEIDHSDYEATRMTGSIERNVSEDHDDYDEKKDKSNIETNVYDVDELRG